MKTAVLDLKGAHCGACAFAIEHTGRKVTGVSDVQVDMFAHEIRVEYAGNEAAPERIAEIVAKLGYDAKVRTASDSSTDA